MNTDPVLLAAKIGHYIKATPGVTYTDLRSRATARGIAPDVFERALEILHRQKTIHRTVKNDDVCYEHREIEVKPTIQPHLEWCRNNYPWPGKNGVPEFVMPWPEWDLSYLFLKPAELAKYKAAQSGRRFIKKKRYEYARG